MGSSAPTETQGFRSGAPPLSKPTFDLTGKHYIVTGGNQGLGLEIARQMKAMGASRLVLLARNAEKGESAAKEISGDGCSATFVVADMASTQSTEDGAKQAFDFLQGRVDGLVNAAGLPARGNLMDTDVEQFDKEYFVNVRAPFILTRAVARQMIEKGIQGRIVNISSVASKGGAPYMTAYAATKAALNVMTQDNAAELAPHGIRVNSVNMGWTNTENEAKWMEQKAGADWLAKVEEDIPLKRMMRPVDVACTVLFLLSPAAEMMTGHAIDLHPENFTGLVSTKAEDKVD